VQRTLRPLGILALVLTVVLTGCAAGDSPATGNSGQASGSIPSVTNNGADAEPTIAKPTGEPPAELVIQDLEEGTGDEAAASSTVTVNYTGLSWSTGETFDSSWLRGEPATFPLANLIQGWQQGIPGMKVGGRRLLVIPPDLGYGPSGGGSIGPNETLVFVIELKAVL
jgi:peptidylprolyl isomerase